MTPKQKAKELYQKMLRVEYPLAAKHCALIAVDEILNYFNEDTIYYQSNGIGVQRAYFENVKQEIEKL
jgi:hypothetical protein